MQIVNISMLFVNGLVPWASTAGEQQSGVNALGERFAQADTTSFPNLGSWLGCRLNRAAQRAEAVFFARLKERSRRAAALELAENIRRLEEVSPHLLEDIGIRKLASGEYERLRESHQLECTSLTLVHDMPAPPDDRSPSTRRKRSAGVTGKAA